MHVFDSLTSFERFLSKKAALAAPTVATAVGEATAVFFASAYETFGDKSKLLLLAPATIKRREYLIATQMPNVGGADSPLLFTGQLRSHLEFFHEGFVGGVGSPDNIMLWQELGTSRIPPRPLLKISVAGAREAGWLVVKHYAAELIDVAAEGGGKLYTTSIGTGGRNILNQNTGAKLRRLPRG